MKAILSSAMALCVMVLMQACSNNAAEQTAPQGKATLNFSVTNYRQYSMDDESEATRATGSVTSLAHLSLGIFNSDGTLKEVITKNSTDDNYSTFSVELPYGTYTLVFMGYNGSHAIQMNSVSNITFADDYVPNCFYYTLPLTVDASTQASQTITMTRAVACFAVECTKGFPSNIQTMTFVAEGGGKAFNALTGLASSTESRTYSSDVSSDAGSTNSQTMNLYTFLPQEECNMTFTLTATDKDAAVIRTRTFSDVPMKRNLRTVYSGDFFAADMASSAFTLQLDTDQWDEQTQTY